MSSFVVRPSRRVTGLFGRRLAVLGLVGALSIGALAPLDAEAKRIGSSRSLGRQSQMAPRADPFASRPARNARSRRSPRSKPRRRPRPPPRSRATAGWPARGTRRRPRHRRSLLSHFGLGEGPRADAFEFSADRRRRVRGRRAVPFHRAQAPSGARFPRRVRRHRVTATSRARRSTRRSPPKLKPWRGPAPRPRWDRRAISQRSGRASSPRGSTRKHSRARRRSRSCGCRRHGIRAIRETSTNSRRPRCSPK